MLTTTNVRMVELQSRLMDAAHVVVLMDLLETNAKQVCFTDILKWVDMES